MNTTHPDNDNEEIADAESLPESDDLRSQNDGDRLPDARQQSGSNPNIVNKLK